MPLARHFGIIFRNGYYGFSKDAVEKDILEWKLN